MKKTITLIFIINMIILLNITKSSFGLNATPDIGSFEETCFCPGPAGYKRICTAQQLQNVQNNLEANYFLCNAIDLQGFPFEPLGPFKGIFDGNNKPISNLNIYLPNNNYVGFFSIINTYENPNETIIKNVKLVNANITGHDWVGALAGQVKRNTIIENCSSSGNIVGNIQYPAGFSIYIGGLIGKFEGKIISNSSSSANVLGDSGVGGLIGYIDPITSFSETVLKSSFATGSVLVTAGAAGGLVGSIRAIFNPLQIEDSYATGDVLCFGDDSDFSGTVGGLIGGINLHDEVNLKRSFSLGNLFCHHQLGGLIGYISHFDGTTISISDSYAMGDLTGSYRIGGLVGYSNYDFQFNLPTVLSIQNSYSTGTLSGDTEVQGTINFSSGTNLQIEIDDTFFNQSANPDLPNDEYNVGKTEVDLKTLSTFQEAGWNILPECVPSTPGQVWKIACPDGTDFPSLLWE